MSYIFEMQEKFEYQWVVHPTPKHREQGCKKIKIDVNTPLPAKYFENPNFTLALFMREANEKTWKYKSNKISTTHLKIVDQSKQLPCGPEVPENYWIKPVGEYMKRAYKLALQSKQQLTPLLWWPALIFTSYLISKLLGLQEILISVTTLITENSSIPTISLGVLAYAASICIYFIVPQTCIRTEKFFQSASLNFYGLLIGATSFVVSSRVLEIATHIAPNFFNLTRDSSRTVISLTYEVVFVVALAFLCQYLFGLFTLINSQASNTDRKKFLFYLVVLTLTTFLGIKYI
ncbi:TPA: hypothetical protein I7762_20700 [Vibrio vulnificus]|nr:hypothetical protein VVDAL7940_01584 [Vibrio vulnificus]OJI46573.1 hypothetical protein VVATL9824_02624 [Vibrio vulnificus]POB21998.1 hypothetical protein CRN22_18685 [Vibrio vulnificus]RAH23907.1 hypothetical protein DOT35_18215 [Vibrio vulnificus]HAS8133438.1 hypothetical protein [Vibrio vulnificus]